MNAAVRALLATSLAAAGLGLLAQCRSGGSGGASRAHAAWGVVYEVLQHPRCLNCHPAGDAPLQGDDSVPHAQNVRRGPDGQGLFAMRCATCHTTENGPDAHLPPGAPHWQLPHPATPLVFEGVSSGDLCRQIQDRQRNGGKSLEEVFHHVAEDELVLWGWEPGPGRAPVPIPHAAFVAAMRTWIDAGCGCPN